jgi:hypothetical protein
MNRRDHTELLAEIKKELSTKGGTFDTLFGADEKNMAQAEFIASVALTAADRLYSRISKTNFEIREQDEHRPQ